MGIPLISLLIMASRSSSGQPLADWYDQTIAAAQAQETADNYEAGILTAGLVLDRLYSAEAARIFAGNRENQGKKMTEQEKTLGMVQLLRQDMLRNQGNPNSLSWRLARVYCPLPPTYLTAAISSVPAGVPTQHTAAYEGHDPRALFVLFGMAVMQQESKFNPNKTSSTDSTQAVGLGQIIPATANRYLEADVSVSGLKSYSTNIQAVLAHLCHLFIQKGNGVFNFDLKTNVLRAYNGSSADSPTPYTRTVKEMYAIYKLLYLREVEARLD